MDHEQLFDRMCADAYVVRSVDRHRLKRAVDVLLASVLLVVLLPLLALIAIAVRLDSPGPVLYVQPRTGYHGRVFPMIKFRTMRPDRRKCQVPIAFADRRRTHKFKDDPRITRFGRLLRRASLDELPQLFNILHGDMSFVGPRPELPELVAQYSALHHLRHLAVPGLTGWWQVHGRCQRPDGCPLQNDLAAKLADDMYYLEHQSFWLDIRILLLTVPVILRGNGAT